MKSVKGQSSGCVCVISCDMLIGQKLIVAVSEIEEWKKLAIFLNIIDDFCLLCYERNS